MIPKEALENYAHFGGGSDYAQHAKVKTDHWGDIDALLMRLQIIDSGYAADSFRADFMSEVEKSGVTLEGLRNLKKLVDKADAERRGKT